jgi:hypothetical protein
MRLDFGNSGEAMAMLLSSDEYARGLVKWSINGGATVTVVSGHDEDAVSSSLLTDAAGSIPDIVAGEDVSISTVANSSSALGAPIWVSWDRLFRDQISTHYIGSEIGELALIGIPGPGQFERLIVSVPYLQWGDGWVVRVGDVIVRLCNSIAVERHERIEEQYADRRTTFVLDFRSHRLDGSFVEIVAPGSIGEQHEIAYAILGIAALVFGDAAIGDLVQLDVLTSTPMGTQFAVRYSHGSDTSAPNRTLRMPIRPNREMLEHFDRLLTQFLEQEGIRADCSLPLRWFERAVRTGNGVDGFLAAFVGLESLIGAQARRIGVESPIADLLRDPEVPELLAPLRARYPHDQIDRLVSRLQNRTPSLRDGFEAVAANLGLSEEDQQAFKSASDARHPLVHGGRGTIDDGVAERSVKLLETMLKAVVGQSADPPVA